MQEPVVDRTEDEIEREVDVDRGDLTALDRFAEAFPGRVAAGLDEARPILLRELWIRVHLDEQFGDDARKRSPTGAPHPRPQIAEQVVA